MNDEERAFQELIKLSQELGLYEDGSCQHPDTYFDRTLCPSPCNSMHDRCITCGEITDDCRLEVEQA